MATKKTDTKIICGGIYEYKEPFKGQTLRTMIVSSMNEGIYKDNRVPTGLMLTQGHAQEIVSEGSERMNQFKLVGKATEVKPVGRPKKATTTKK